MNQTIAAMLGRSPLLAALGIIAVLSLILSAAIRLPGVPYNLRELFLGGGAAPAVIVFSMALLWIGAGPYLAAWAVRRSARPIIWMPVAVLAISWASLLMLSLSVTQESLDDICGANDFYRRAVQDIRWGASLRELLQPWPNGLVSFFERVVRYSALYGHIAVLMTFLFMWTLERKAGRLTPLMAACMLYVVALYLWLCKTVVIDWAITDNLTELIARDGLVFLYLVLGVLALHASYLSSAKRDGRSIALAAMLTVAALPATWWLLNQGLESHVHKYQRVFSAVQFLLGPDREHTLSQTMLFLRWAVLYLGGIAVIALGARLMQSTLAPRSRASAADPVEQSTPSDDKNSERPTLGP